MSEFKTPLPLLLEFTRKLADPEVQHIHNRYKVVMM